MKKTSKAKVARVYSTALYDAAVENGAVDKVWNDMIELRRLLEENVDFGKYMANPLWSDEDKFDVLNKTAEIQGFCVDTLNCLQILVENRRMKDLSLIVDDFKNVYYQKNNIAEVVVETVKALSALQDNRLKKVLESALSRKVAIVYKINSALLGGLRVQCESMMFDDSLSRKLNYLENMMKGK